MSATTENKNLGILTLCLNQSLVIQKVHYFALSVAKSMMKDNNYKNCLVIGADSMSKLLDWNDRSTAVLFGDGAGAVILEQKKASDNELNDWGILSNIIYMSKD